MVSLPICNDVLSRHVDVQGGDVDVGSDILYLSQLHEFLAEAKGERQHRDAHNIECTQKATTLILKAIRCLGTKLLNRKRGKCAYVPMRSEEAPSL